MQSNVRLCSHCGQPLGRLHKKLELLSKGKETFRYHSDCYFKIQPEIEKVFATGSARKRIIAKAVKELAKWKKHKAMYSQEETGQWSLNLGI